MSEFTRMRTDGAFSLDLEADASPAISFFPHSFTSDNAPNHTAGAQHLGTDMWMNNVSAAIGSLSSLGPRRQSAPSYNMQERIVQEEQWHSLRECTFQPRICNRSRELATQKGRDGNSATRPEVQRSPPRRVGNSSDVQRKKLREQRSNSVPKTPVRLSNFYNSDTIHNKDTNPNENGGSDKNHTEADNNDNKSNRDDRAAEGPEVFGRLYGDAQRIQRKQDALRTQRIEQEEEEAVAAIRTPRRVSPAARRELFMRLSMPTLREKKAVDVHEDIVDTMETKESIFPLVWPLPILPTLTLDDLKRHNRLATEAT